MRRKILLILLPFFLLVGVLYHLTRIRVNPTGELSDATVAKRIIKDGGYQMFHFNPKTTRPYVLIVRIKGVDSTRLHIEASEQYIVTVQLDKQLNPTFVRVDSNSGMCSASGGNPRRFSSFDQRTVILDNDPFLTLDGPDGKLEIVMVPQST